MGTFVASFHYMKKGFMKWKICIPAVFGAIAGSWIGSHLALLISEKALKIAMLVVLPVILFYVLRSKALKGKDENATEVINGMLIFKSILIAAVVGIYDGIYRFLSYDIKRCSRCHKGNQSDNQYHSTCRISDQWQSAFATGNCSRSL